MELCTQYKYICLNSSVVDLSAFNTKGPEFNPGPSILFICRLQRQHLTTAGYRALINCCKAGAVYDFFSLVNKRLCSPGLKHCLNVYSVVLCTLGTK